MKPTKEEIELVARKIADDFSSDPTGSVLMALDAIQTRFGYVPKESFCTFADAFNIPIERFEAVCDFFKSFTTEPVGEHIIEVCDGTACHMQQAPEILQLLEQTLNIEVGHTTPDGQFTLRVVRCVGSCGSAPVASIDGKMIAKIRLADAAQIMRYADDD